jgi:hypothetical protein
MRFGETLVLFGIWGHEKHFPAPRRRTFGSTGRRKNLVTGYKTKSPSRIAIGPQPGGLRGNL